MHYPLPRNHFQVQWGGANLGFCEVSGLSVEMDAPRLRDGMAPENTSSFMPGQLSHPPLILKRPVVKGDNEFFAWFNTARLNVTERRDIVVSLLNERHEPVVFWTFRNAFPVRLDYSTLDAHSSEPMMEILEIRHEGMKVEHS